MTAVRSPFSRAQYAYAVCTTDPGSPKWFSHLHAARHHAIAPARACVGIHDFEGAVLEIHQRQRRQIDGDVAERNPLCSRNLGGGQEQRAPGPARAQA